jgi:signal transduction histidine kinase
LKRIATLLGFYLVVTYCNAQITKDTSVVSIDDIVEKFYLAPKTTMYIDSSSSISTEKALLNTFLPFQNINNYKKLSPEQITYTYYLKIPVQNKLAREFCIYLFPGVYFETFDAFKLKGNNLVKINFADSISGYKKITLSGEENTTLIIKLKPLKNDFNSINPLFISSNFIKNYKLYVIGYKADTQIYGLVLSGVLLMMILFMFTNFVISKKLEFLYNTGYSLCMFLLVFLNSILIRYTSAFCSFYYNYMDFFLLAVGVVFYMAFTRNFLDTKKNYLLLDRILKYGENFVLLLLGIYTYLNFFTNTYLPQFYLENFMKIGILAIGIAFIYLALKRRDRLFNYIAAGNAMLVLFSVISFTLLLVNVKPIILYTSPLFYYNTGIALELVFFLLGLTYKNRNELIKNIKEQEALKQEAERLEFETQITVMKAQQEERNRISADMHDDLGAGMTSIRLYSELAKRKLINTPIPEIEKISSSANELLSKMNAIIWSMSSSNDTLNNMIAYIRSYALEYFEDTGVNCKISIPENLPNVEVVGEIRRNVFLVVKEALNNILKHSKATEVNIKLVRAQDGLTLYIQDNGTGIDMNKLRQFGNGLKNMKKRMEAIKIDFTIENSEGTLITLHRKIATF